MSTEFQFGKVKNSGDEARRQLQNNVNALNARGLCA